MPGSWKRGWNQHLKGKKQGVRKLPDPLLIFGGRFGARANLYSREMLKYETPAFSLVQLPAFSDLIAWK
jgi:hypothetical protein